MQPRELRNHLAVARQALKNELSYEDSDGEVCDNLWQDIRGLRRELYETRTTSHPRYTSADKRYHLAVNRAWHKADPNEPFAFTRYQERYLETLRTVMEVAF